MAQIIGIGGSLRKASYNRGLLRAAAQLMPDGSSLDVHTIDGIPLFSEDVEAESGPPKGVTVLRQALAEADGLLIATPEYNSSIPGVLKNAIDWMSRPPREVARVFGGKPVAVIGASPGGFGTVLAQEAWLPVFRFLGLAPWFGRKLTVSKAGSLFDAEGNLTDADTREQLRAYLADFVAAIGRTGEG